MRDHPATPWIAGISIVLAVAGAIGASIAVVRIPADYFVRNERPRPGAGRIARNVLGWLLVIAGLAMLIIPGPGAVALLAGLVLVDFPGRQKLLRWIITRTGVVKGMNRLRKRHGKPPLHTDDPGRPRRKARFAGA
ncbi:MAG TPA: PGPGW domain-containing protein [Phycisphaerales bacterium]|nr:PGPGW domain-containing protein [Phycisphaerales bacterium]